MLLGLALPHNSAAHSDARRAACLIGRQCSRAGGCERYTAERTLPRISRLLHFSLPALLAPAVASAEVSDKIPSIGGFWLTSLLLALATVALSRLRCWAGLILLPLSVILIAGALDVVRDPYVGPAAIREQGSWYPIAAYGSSILLVLGHLVGLWVGRRTLRNRKQTAV